MSEPDDFDGCDFHHAELLLAALSEMGFRVCKRWTARGAET